ncbi:RNA degradosome polyphosphate kinase [candidate division KSB1 bacterium]|nr:RNA degradosome polyphosphate kinase [candidate division KSB1 bacterium]
MTRIKENAQYSKKQYFISRELSWLEFNKRVLEEAIDTNNPLMERLKFISIFSSNLDEFFMVRVGGLKDQIEAGYQETDPAGMTPEQQIKQIAKNTSVLVEQQYNCLKRSILPQLKKYGIEYKKYSQLNDEQIEHVQDYFHNSIYSVLTPMAFDPGHPFPVIINRTLYFIITLTKEGHKKPFFAFMQVPTVFPRLIRIPADKGFAFIYIEDIIRHHLPLLFKGYKIQSEFLFRITRNADFDLDEEGAEDLLAEIAKKLKSRKTGKVMRLELENSADNSALLNMLIDEFQIKSYEIYQHLNPLDLTFVKHLADLPGFKELKYSESPPNPSSLFKSESIFDDIKQRDIFLHVPFESFDPVVKLVESAADDPQVLAIKQVLYRVSGNSPIIHALARAAEKGKQVSVLIELKARFDEESNINWAQKLERAGCHVVYGIVGLKTHCKALLIVRKEEEGVRRYVHLGTGNYNDITAKIYTDCSIFTVKQDFGADVSDLFNLITGYSEPRNWRKLAVAPLNLREKFIHLIENEIAHSQAGRTGHIIAKMNSLVDTKIIQCLYKASCQKVKIELIVRGICCLRPGIPGISENITVRSIVGRYLEHSRIFYFENGGEPLYYLSSADWMPRNLDRRIETLFPVENPDAQQRLNEILELNLQDNIKSRVLNADGHYSRVNRRGKEPLNSQEKLYRVAIPKSQVTQFIFNPIFEVSSRDD